jgi:hypothetical protein
MYFKETPIMYCVWIAHSPTRKWSVRGWNALNWFTAGSDAKC